MKKIIIPGIVCFLWQLVLISQTTITDDFYDPNSIQQIKITLKHQNWQPILDSLRKNGDNLLVGSAEINGTMLKNIGLQYRKSRSFKIGQSKNPLMIKLNFIDKNQVYEGYRTIQLSNALRDPSMVREVLGYEIAGNYMPAPRANYAQVYINEEYYGLFVNVEVVDPVFLGRHFGDMDGSFINCDPDLKSFSSEGCKKNIYSSLFYEEDAACYLNRYELISENGWDDLIRLTKMLKDGNENIESVLDVDQCLWMLAFNNVLVNLNSYSGRQSQNYYLYQDQSGRFHPVIGDLNLSFGSYKSAHTGSDLRLKQLQELDPLMHINNQYKPLISQLLKVDRYQKIYLSHMRTILYDHFVNDSYKERATYLQSLIQVPFINDKNKSYSFENFKNGMKTTVGKRSRIPGITELMGRRTRLLRKASAFRVIPPEISAVKVLKREQYESATINDFTIVAQVDKLPRKVKLYYRYSKEQNFQTTDMYDDGKNNDGAPGDGLYGITIKKGSTDQIEYYLEAENAASISFDPPRYMYQLHQANIAELN